MRKKNRFKLTAAAFLALAMTFGATGCDAFITTDNAENMKQVVASVNISNRLADEENAYAEAVRTIIENGGLNTDIPKRDLVAYFLNTGYTYVQSYGYTYAETFELLLDNLINRKVMVQYAISYYLAKTDNYSQTACDAYVTAQINAATGVEKTLLENHREVLTLKYFLTNGGKTTAEDTESYDKAVYTLNKTVNDSLDDLEADYIKESDPAHEHGETRTLPTGAGTEKEDYFVAPAVDGLGEVQTYKVYTGRNDASTCYGYETLDGSTVTTRIKAYNEFLKNLQGNSLILPGEDTTDFTKMDYYYVELNGQLETALITKYTEDLKKEGEDDLLRNDPDSYVANRYQETLSAEQFKYTKDESGFETAIDALGDDSFTLYAPKANYGFVYNILIPFSNVQNDMYEAESKRDVSATELATYRAGLLQNVQAKDLRDSWFCGYDDDNYAYEATGDYYQSIVSPGSNYLFFEDNFTNTSRYEDLGQYFGKYPFNGTVTKEDEDYVVKSNKVGIDDFIDEVEAYLSYATGGLTVSGDYYDGYVDVNGQDKEGNTYAYDKAKDKFTDYSQFMYYTGQVQFTEEFSAQNYFKANTQAYNAVSAFNELMFAYSTDTGCLNTYMGYVVSPYKTDFVGEFEYAAQYAIANLGVGGYVVCPSTYGWHIIYVSFVYEGGEVYDGGFDASKKDEDGTFSQLYFEMVKNSYVDEYASQVQSRALEAMTGDDTVTRYADRYADLTSNG